MEKKVLEQVLDTVTLEFVEENPLECYDLMQWMIAELYHRKDVIERQHEKELLLRAMIEDLKSKNV